MEFLIKAAQLLLSLSILIVLHELGHFLPAKWFNTRVEKFYLFFDAGFSLFKFKKGETEYGIGWLPLGGYVKIAGMIDESMDNENLSEEPQPWEFRSKPAWQRLIIMIGGVTVNLILGFVIYMMLLFVWGKDIKTQGDLPHGYAVADEMKQYGFRDGDIIIGRNGEKLDDVSAGNIFTFLLFRNNESFEVLHADGTTESLTVPDNIGDLIFEKEFRPFQDRKYPVIDSVIANKPAEIAGLLKGDSILSVNDTSIVWWHEATKIIQNTPIDSKVTFIVYRDGAELELISEHEKNQVGMISIPRSHHIDYGFGSSISEGFAYGYWTLHDYVVQFRYVFTSKGATSVGGFGAIGSMFPSAWDWQIFWKRTAFISIILAFMNILPIPALDGGHVMFLIYEMISGKAPSDKFLIRAQVVGMVLLLSLLLYANGMDIYRWLFPG